MADEEREGRTCRVVKMSRGGKVIAEKASREREIDFSLLSRTVGAAILVFTKV